MQQAIHAEPAVYARIIFDPVVLIDGCVEGRAQQRSSPPLKVDAPRLSPLSTWPPNDRSDMKDYNARRNVMSSVSSC